MIKTTRVKDGYRWEIREDGFKLSIRSQQRLVNDRGRGYYWHVDGSLMKFESYVMLSAFMAHWSAKDWSECADKGLYGGCLP